MPLFQKSVIAKYLKSQNKEHIDSKWNSYSNHFLSPKVQEDIRNLKEEQYQGEFLEDLFVKILGYTKPASSSETKFNLTTEYKNVKDSKKADGAIIIDDKVKAVIELKGTNTTDLGKIEVQAFGYKNNQPDCVYVITSNFEKLRFYIDNAIEHIEFNLFSLTEDEFQLLYLCLGFDNLSQNVGKKIKDESLSEEDVITKKLYKDYSLFKRELHQNLVLLNPDFEPLELFKKSQKLLDRFLFLFFGEDRHLLPPNSVRLILTQWNQLRELDEYSPLYERFKKYFGYLNTGYKGVKHNVFAYNGGLFKADEILDHIKIDDDLLYKHTLKLSEYDFASEVDVNILGHIFENSLNELDEIKAQLEGQEIDKSKTKRKKDGVFYTPKYITKYIVENTVGKLCEEKKQALEILEEEYFTDKKRQKKTIQGLVEKIDAYRKWLLQLTICDPACGSGAFLNQALDFLIEEHQYIDELQAKLFGDALVMSDMENSILENNLFGVDLNEESVEIAKLSLWLRTAQPNRKLNDLNGNIKCGNSLIDDVAVAGDKAFNWQEAFPKVFEKGGFDVIIGNPPYVNIVNILNKEEREFYQKHYETVKNKSDLYSIFIEKGYSILKKDGQLGFIFPNSWLGTESFSNLRKYLIEKTTINELVKLPNDVFADAVVTPLIMLFKKAYPSNNELINLKEYINNEFKMLKNNLSYERIKNSQTYTFSFLPEIKIKNQFLKLGDIADFSLGIKTSDDNRFIFNDKIDKDCFPLLRGRNISKYYYTKNTEWIWYKPELITEKAGGRPRILQNFLGEKIYIQDISKSINACYCDEVILSNDTLNLIYKVDEKYNLKTILVLLNSVFVNKWFESNFQEGLHIKINQLQQIPIPKISLTEQKPLIEKAEQMIYLNREQQEQSQKFQRIIQRKFELEELPKKLQDWYKLSYSEFIKELAKKKVKLSLSQEAEWEDYFMQESKKALELKATIDATDKAIDAMVYELYGLNEEEIAIVENS